MDIDQSAMCYLSMDLFRHALQTYDSIFQISESFFKIIVALGLCIQSGEAFVLINTRSSFLDCEYDLYFMLGIFKFQHKKTKHKISVVSAVKKNSLV